MKREEMKLTERRKVRVGGSGCGHLQAGRRHAVEVEAKFRCDPEEIEFAPTPVRALAGLQAT